MVAPLVCLFYSSLDVQRNGLSQELVRNLRIFTENWISRLQKVDFDDFYTIGSEFASRTRSHTPFPAVSAKNAVSEIVTAKFYGNFPKNSGLFFCEYPLIRMYGSNVLLITPFCNGTWDQWYLKMGRSKWRSNWRSKWRSKWMHQFYDLLKQGRFAPPSN